MRDTVINLHKSMPNKRCASPSLRICADQTRILISLFNERSWNNSVIVKHYFKVGIM